MCANPEIRGNSLGGGNSIGLRSDTVRITLKFRDVVKNVRDERTGKALGDGREFAFEWKRNEAIVVSYEMRIEG